MDMNEPSQPSVDMGAFLRHVRITLELNLRDAARLAGVDYSTLSKVERGERTPSDSWLRTYIESLGAVAADSRGRAA